MKAPRIAGPRASTTPDIEPGANPSGRPRVRVIWGGACGSTYQGYYPPGRRAPPARPEGHLHPPRGCSIFSRPLTCPTCQHALEIHQVDPESPDRLLGTCLDCATRALLDVGEGGRITLTVLPGSE